MLCFTHPFLCATPELNENCEKEVPENVVDPLYSSSPLSILQPNNLAQYENKSEDLSQHESEIKNLSYYESKSNTLSLYESETKNVPLDEYKPKDLPQHERKSENVPLDENKPKNVPQCEKEPNNLSLSESKSKNLSLHESEAYNLSLMENELKNASPRDWSNKKPPLTWAKYVTKEMVRDWSNKKPPLTWATYVKKEMVVKRTLRSVEAGVFELLPPECQQSWRDGSYMDDDVCVCCEYTRVGKNGGKTGGCECTSTLGSVILYSVDSCTDMPNRSVFRCNSSLYY